MKTGTDLWYNTGEEGVTMKLALPRTKVPIAEFGIDIDATDAAMFFDGL